MEEDDDDDDDDFLNVICLAKQSARDLPLVG
jgi:hypothetical protein